MSEVDPHEKALAQAREEGRVAQILVEHGKHFDQINGSIDKSAEALNDLRGEIRGVREDMRLAAERVEVAASVLAQETERRREALAETVGAGDRKFTRRERVFALVLAIAVPALGLIASGTIHF
jgi:methyl-accepting chemotaxis protein